MTPEAKAQDSPAVARHCQSCVVGTLNLLGDAFNPFEFLPLEDERFMKQYDVLKARFQELTWTEVKEAGAEILKDRPTEDPLQAALKHLQDLSSLWTFFTEEVLKRDNKLLDHRTNLLTMAMKPVGDRLQCDLCGELPKAPWIGQMQTQLSADQSYVADPHLFVFDVVCNVVASTCRSQYTEICSGSYLHPANYQATIKTFLRSIDAPMGDLHGLPVVIGFQEFPAEESPKAEVYERLLSSNGYGLVRSRSSTALVHRGFGSAAIRRLTPEVFDPKDVMRQCIDQFCEGGSQSSSVDEKTRGSLINTTADKTLAVEISNLICIIVHAKEPKLPVEASILARYMRAVASKAQSHCITAGRQKAWVLFSDTNLCADHTRDSFHTALRDESSGPAALWVPTPSRATTAKHRSLLHGQCYDTKKCGKTVVAHKDYIVTSTPSCLHECRVTPELQIHPDGGVARTVPSPDWGSDHCLVTAVFSPYPADVLDELLLQKFDTILQAFKSKDPTGTGSIQPDILKMLFKQLDSSIFLDDDCFNVLIKQSGTLQAGEVQYEDFLRWLFCFEASMPLTGT